MTNSSVFVESSFKNKGPMNTFILCLICFLVGATASFLLFNKTSLIVEYEKKESSANEKINKLQEEKRFLEEKLKRLPIQEETKFIGPTSNEMVKAFKQACSPSTVSVRQQPKLANTVTRHPKERPPVGSQVAKPFAKPYTPWGYVQHDATPQNPKACFTSDKITGASPRCTSFEVVSVNPGETQSQWIARIASEKLDMKGFNTKIIGKN